MKRASMYLVLVVILVTLTGRAAASDDKLFIESRLSNFIQKFYDGDDEMQIKFGSIPAALRGKPAIRSVSFAKIPDMQGEGVCLVDIEGKNNRDRSVYVPFRVIRKLKIFVLNASCRKGHVIRPDDLSSRETYQNERRAGFPTNIEEVNGRVLTRDVPAGTAIAYAFLEEPILIQKGEIVNIIAENMRLTVQSKGKAMEKGKKGESIRVKNISSDKEITGKVINGNTILVSF
jgi:flagellar basal body P-ring formation protein FlgA